MFLQESDFQRVLPLEFFEKIFKKIELDMVSGRDAEPEPRSRSRTFFAGAGAGAGVAFFGPAPAPDKV